GRVCASPVCSDIDPRAYNLDIVKVPGRITRKTKAILRTHPVGLPANTGSIRHLAAPAGLTVRGESVKADGAPSMGKPAPAPGDVATMCFYSPKSLGALGDGGACLTDDDALAKKLRTLRVHGLEPGFVVHKLGGAFRLDALQAAILSVKLPHLAGWT